MVTIWFDNGNKDREGVIRGNEPEGKWSYYYPDGKLDFIFDYGSGLERVRISELENRDGIFYKIGKYKPYSGMVIETGGIKDYLLLGRFQTGKDGQWVQWYRNGQKKLKEFIIEVQAWRMTLWYEEGNLKDRVHLIWVKLMVFTNTGIQMTLKG